MNAKQKEAIEILLRALYSMPHGLRPMEEPMRELAMEYLQDQGVSVTIVEEEVIEFIIQATIEQAKTTGGTN